MWRSARRRVRIKFWMSPDTVSDVIHDAAQRPCGRRRSGIVGNSAERSMAVVHKLSSAKRGSSADGMVDRPKDTLPAVHAAMQSRLDVPQPKRLKVRSPDCVEAPVQKSERTSSPRGLRIRSTGDRFSAWKQASSPSAGARRMDQQTFDQFTHFGGFDWARASHHIVIVDRGGQVVLSLGFDDDAQGWATLREKIGQLPRLAVAIETSCGPAVERLLEMNLPVFPLNPKAAERYRDRKSPAGVKDDERDALSF